MPGTTSPPGTPSTSSGVQRLRQQLLSREARLSPYARIGIQKACNIAQQALTEAAILRYNNKQLRYRLQQEEARNSQKRLIVGRARVVSEKDI
jgi:regulator of replication initiation timing